MFDFLNLAVKLPGMTPADITTLLIAWAIIFAVWLSLRKESPRARYAGAVRDRETVCTHTLYLGGLTPKRAEEIELGSGATLLCREPDRWTLREYRPTRMDPALELVQAFVILPRSLRGMY